MPSDMEAKRSVEIPTSTKTAKSIPDHKEINTEVPVPKELDKTIPDPKKLDKDPPKEFNEENCIFLKGKMIEIKPTKVKYFRNKTANIYEILKVCPLTEFLSYDKGIFDVDRDGDQLLFDFLVSVFNDSALVRDNYDDMTSEDIEKILKIFGRLNHIDEKKEQQRKNREAQAAIR